MDDSSRESGPDLNAEAHSYRPSRNLASSCYYQSVAHPLNSHPWFLRIFTWVYPWFHLFHIFHWRGFLGSAARIGKTGIYSPCSCDTQLSSETCAPADSVSRFRDSTGLETIQDEIRLKVPNRMPRYLCPLFAAMFTDSV